MTPGRWLALTTLALALAWPASARAYETQWVDATVNTRLVKCGEPFQFMLTAGARNGWVRLPGKNAVLPGMEVLDYREQDVSKRHEGYLARQGIYRLAVFSMEEAILPPLRVVFAWADGNTTAAASLPLRVGIRSLQPEPGFALIDPRPPRRAHSLWGTLLLSGGLLAAAFWVAVMWKPRPPKKRPVPPAHLEALRRLEMLGTSRSVAEAPKNEKYFTELSHIIRKYLAQRYQFPALELNRSAIIRSLVEKGVEAKRRELTNRLLQETDLVKFAQEPVDFKRVATAHGLAREIINLTRERPITQSGGEKA